MVSCDKHRNDGGGVWLRIASLTQILTNLIKFDQMVKLMIGSDHLFEDWVREVVYGQ